MESDNNICYCLWDALVNDDPKCVLYDDIEDIEINFREQLEDLYDIEDFEPDFLLLFNNEKIHWLGKDFYQVYRIITSTYVYDMMLLEKFGFRFYTNGISGEDGRYIAMENREVIIQQHCPITYTSIKDYLHRHHRYDEFEAIDDIMDKLPKRKYSEDND